MAANLYSLPCPQCQQPVQLQPRQAGQLVTCQSCEAEFEAPRLGQFKNLQSVENEADAVLTPASGSMLSRWLFTLGLAIAVFLGAAGVGVYQFASSIQNEIDPQGAAAAYEADIDSLSDAEVYQVAAGYKADATIGEYFQPATIKNNKQGEILKTIAYGLLGLAAAGVVMIASSFVVK